MFTFFAEINQIVKGHISDPLLFYTAPTSPPDDLKCLLNTDMSLEFSWKLPRTGMTNSIENIDMDYHFAYWIKEETDDSSGMLNFHALEKCFKFCHIFGTLKLKIFGYSFGDTLFFLVLVYVNIDQGIY